MSSPNGMNISKQLNVIDKSLSDDQLEAVSFLCAAAASIRQLYGESISLNPSIPDCYTALKESRESQQNASRLLLFTLTFVGCSQHLVEELRQLTLGCEDVGEDIHTLLSEEAKQNLYFRELLYGVSENLTGEDVSSFIHFSSSFLLPPRNARYTRSLLVHFNNLMDQKILTLLNLNHLRDIVTEIGKISTLDKLEAYCLAVKEKDTEHKHSLSSLNGTESETTPPPVVKERLQEAKLNLDIEATPTTVVSQEERRNQLPAGNSLFVYQDGESICPLPKLAGSKRESLLSGPVIADKAEHITKDVCFPHNPAGLATAAEPSPKDVRLSHNPCSATAGDGKTTREYKAVLHNLLAIVNTLKSDGGKKGTLTIKFREMSWIDLCSEPDEEELVRIVLVRIEEDVQTFRTFVDVLKCMEGMDQILQMLTTSVTMEL